jgi:hypothetical protein
MTLAILTMLMMVFRSGFVGRGSLRSSPNPLPQNRSSIRAICIKLHADNPGTRRDGRDGDIVRQGRRLLPDLLLPPARGSCRCSSFPRLGRLLLYVIMGNGLRSPNPASSFLRALCNWAATVPGVMSSALAISLWFMPICQCIRAIRC